MVNLNAEKIAHAKSMGFLLNHGTNLFSGRVVGYGTVFSAQDFQVLSYMAEHFGSGKLICTSRQAIELPGIPYEQIDAVMAYAEQHNLHFGGTGNKIRPITACKGTTCVYGNFDTQAMAQRIHDQFYVGWSHVKLPHKFKIAVGGCPNSCIKPSLNDFGIEGHRSPDYDPEACRGCKVCMVEKSCPMKAAKVVDGKLTIHREDCNDCGVCAGKCPFRAVAHEGEVLYQIYVGGTWGKRTRMGTPLSRMGREEEVLPILEKALLWFKQNGYAKERFGMTIDRLGMETLENALFSDELLEQRAPILEAEILQQV